MTGSFFFQTWASPSVFLGIARVFVGFSPAPHPQDLQLHFPGAGDNAARAHDIITTNSFLTDTSSRENLTKSPQTKREKQTKLIKFPVGLRSDLFREAGAKRREVLPAWFESEEEGGVGGTGEAAVQTSDACSVNTLWLQRDQTWGDPWDGRF